MADQANVNTPSVEYADRADAWKRARALLGGTKAMRTAGEDYLPKFSAEDDDAYKRRLNATVLHAGFAKIIKTMAGLPFGRPVDVGDDMFPRFKGWAEDIDQKGTHIDIFGRRLFAEGLGMGASHILVDMDATVGATAAADLSRRPRWRRIRPEDLLDVQTALVDGKERPIYVRIREVRETRVGFVKKTEIVVREIGSGQWKVWKKAPKGDEWVVDSAGPYDMPFVTLATFLAGDALSAFTAESPLENCQHLNVTHWQSSSDQRNILTFSRFGMLMVKGMRLRDKFAVGPNTLIDVELNGDAKIVEHTGAAIQAGERDLEKLEQLMEAEGLRLLVRSQGTFTATEARGDDVKEQSELEALARAFGDTLELAASYTADWVNEKAKGSVTVYSDFGIVANALAIKDTVLKLREMGDLSGKDALEELQRAGLLSDALDVDAALEAAAEDVMRTLGGSMNQNGPDALNPDPANPNPAPGNGNG